MLKRLIAGAGAILALVTLSACATRMPDNGGGQHLSGSYFVTSWEGDEPDDPTAKPFTAEDYDHLAFLQQVCDRQMREQRPNAIVEIGHDVIISTLTNAPGVAGGAKAGFGAAVKAGNYALYGAGAGAGAGANGGISGRGHANRYDIGQCMYQHVSWAQRYKGDLLGKGIVVNAHSVDGRGLRRPSLTQAQMDARMDQQPHVPSRPLSDADLNNPPPPPLP